MKLRNLSAIFIAFILITVSLPQAYAAVADPYSSIPVASYNETDAPDKFQKKSEYVAMNARIHTSYICFKNVEFTDSPYAVVISTATTSDWLQGNTYEFRIDSPKGELISTVYVTRCDTWGVPKENVGTVEKTVRGIHDLYISTNKPNDFYNFYFKAIKKESLFISHTEKTVFFQI